MDQDWKYLRGYKSKVVTKQLRHTGFACMVRNQRSFLAFNIHRAYYILGWGRGVPG